MKRIALTVVLLLSALASAWAQSVPNHALPIGRGPGVSGFNSLLPCVDAAIQFPGTSSDPACTTTPTLGVPGTSVGSLSFGNLTSGTVLLQPATGALGSAVWTLRAATDNVVGATTVDIFANKTIDTATSTFKINGSQWIGLGATLALSTTTLQTGAATGDVTWSANSFVTTVANIPTGVTVAGSLLFSNIAAPSTPASGKTSIWTDSTDKRIHDKNDAGAIGTTVVADTGAASNFLTAISAAGAISKARPTCANLSDSSGGCSMSTTAGGDLSGTLPSPTVAKVNGVTYGASPGTNTLPVVTSSNTVTYEAVPNAALANSATTVNGQTCTLGSTCTVTASATAVTVGTTTVSSGTSTRVLFDNVGVLGEYAQIPLANGGTNAALTASNGGIFYSTASAGAILSGTATAGQHLQSGASGAPTWTTATFPATATGTGTILRADGTNWAATTATYPATAAQGDIIFGSAANVISALTKSTTATRYLANTGTSNSPAWDQVNLANGVTGTLSGTNLPGYVLNQIINETGTVTYTPAANTRAIYFIVVGGGGGGGFATGVASQVGAGSGGAGGMCSVKFTTSISASYTVTVGGGGNGGSSPTAAQAGGDSTVADAGAVTIASGIGGGAGVDSTASASLQVNAGGAPGTGGVGDYTERGGPGGPGFSLIPGSGIGVGGNGGNAGCFGGGGARGQTTVGAAAGANNTGGGGGGSLSTAAVNRAGGNGGSGFVQIFEYK